MRWYIDSWTWFCANSRLDLALYFCGHCQQNRRENLGLTAENTYLRPENWYVSRLWFLKDFLYQDGCKPIICEYKSLKETHQSGRENTLSLGPAPYRRPAPGSLSRFEGLVLTTLYLSWINLFTFLNNIFQTFQEMFFINFMSEQFMWYEILVIAK